MLNCPSVQKPQNITSSKNVTTSDEQPSSVTEVAKSVFLNTELVQVKAKGDILKIDCITPGLYTADIRVVMYDLKNNKALSETDLGEKYWETGITENGFYAIDIDEKTLYIYDNAGKVTKQKTFTDSEKWSSACCVSADETTFLYTTAKDGEIFLYNIKEDILQKIEGSKFYADKAEFNNGKFFLIGVDNELTEITSDGKLSEIPNEIKANYVTTDFGVKTTENNFAVYDIQNDKTVFVPFEIAEETVVGIGKEGFTTAVFKDNGSVLRIYNIKEKNVSKIESEENVESVCYTDDGKILIVAGSPADKTHKLYLASPTEKNPLEIKDNDDAAK